MKRRTPEGYIAILKLRLEDRERIVKQKNEAIALYVGQIDRLYDQLATEKKNVELWVVRAGEAEHPIEMPDMEMIDYGKNQRL